MLGMMPVLQVPSENKIWMSTWGALRDQVAIFAILSGFQEGLESSQVPFCLYNVNCGVEKLNIQRKNPKH